MIVDASAVLAILYGEPEEEIFRQAIAHADTPQISAVNFVEVAIRVDRENSLLAVNKLSDFLDLARLVIAPVTPGQAFLARRAYAEYGKGRHPAGLNLGDCFAYALAKDQAAPLLFKGSDFSQTDIVAAASV